MAREQIEYCSAKVSFEIASIVSSRFVIIFLLTADIIVWIYVSPFLSGIHNKFIEIENERILRMIVIEHIFFLSFKKKLNTTTLRYRLKSKMIENSLFMINCITVVVIWFHVFLESCDRIIILIKQSWLLFLFFCSLSLQRRKFFGLLWISEYLEFYFIISVF